MSAGPFEAMAALILTGTEAGLFLAAEHLVGEARAVVPNRDGDLERSIVSVVKGTEAIVVADTPYAVPQHENETYKHRGGRTDHYLTGPAEKAAADGTLERLVAQGIDDRMGGA